MRADKIYDIAFEGLKDGFHHFDYKIGKEFFELFDYSELKEGDLNTSLELEKKINMMILNFEIKGWVAVACDRCAAEMQQQIAVQEKLVVKLHGAEDSGNDDLITVPESADKINVAHNIYEYIVLALPQRKVHPDDEKGISTCDPEAIKKLEEIRVENKKEKNDPRWDALKNIANKN